MPKEFSFRGKKIEDLQALSLEELSKLLTSRERRKIKRGFTAQEKKLFENIKKNPGKFHKTHVRSMIVLPQMVGAKVGVFSGKEWVQIDITPHMVGYRLGDFSVPVKRVKHSAPGIGASRGSKHVAVK